MWTETVKIDYGNEGIRGKIRTISVTYPLTTDSTRIFASQNDEKTLWRIEALTVDVLAFPVLQGDSDRWCSQSTTVWYQNLCSLPCTSRLMCRYIHYVHVDVGTETLCQSFPWPESFSLPFFKKQGTPEYQFGLPGKLSNRFEFTNSSSLQANWRWMLLEFDFRWPSTFNQLTGRHSGKM